MAPDFVKISNPYALSLAERSHLLAKVAQDNWALYEFAKYYNLTESKAAVISLGKQLGLRRLDRHLLADEDAVTPLAVPELNKRANYIPYTNKAVSWHTDGYYNSPDKTIRAFILHNHALPKSGGANKIVNHEVLYDWLKEQDWRYIEALKKADALTIPANMVDAEEVRPASTGPVFSYDADDNLQMRFTARKHNIIWQEDKWLQEAVTKIHEFLNDSESYIHKVRLEPGQGIVCNNVLHNREAFINDAKRQRVMLRARYYDRIIDT